MHIKNEFEVPLPPAEAWSLLMNVPVAASCFPGAELNETIDANNYKGRVAVKLGPVKMAFSGKLRLDNRDDARRSASVKATWTETKGRGNAVTVTRFSLRDQGSGTLVVVESDLQLAGQVAQYGRGAGMISELSAQLIAKFANNLRAHIQAASAPQSIVQPAAAAPREIPPERPAAPPAKEISVIELLWKALVDRFKRLFS
ncbi:MAG TPA: SRPBCC family protein [Burkholderiales bacterium]|nr:SRPBCC family protein [Burkholderiales bacterium]